MVRTRKIGLYLENEEQDGRVTEWKCHGRKKRCFRGKHA